MTDLGIACGLPEGTPVLTPGGLVAVDALSPGMMVLAVSGAAAPFMPLVALRRARYAGPMVRLRARAIEDGTPQSDLLLPAGHALLLDGALVPAGSLVDGWGILAETPAEPVALFTPVLARHDAVLAAGLAVETGLPEAGSPRCAERRDAGGALRAALRWRAERLGWASPPPLPPALPELPLRAGLATRPLVPPQPGPSVPPGKTR